MTDEKTREEVTEKIISMFIKCIGWITREQVILDINMASGLKVYDDDITVFIMHVENYFDMRLTQNEWGRVNSLQETIDLAMQYRGMKLRPEPEKGLWAWLRRWIF